MRFVTQSYLLLTAALTGGCQLARDATGDMPRVVHRVHTELGERPLLRRAIVTTACLMLGCSTYMAGPGTPLAQAAHAGNIAEMRRLVAAGADPNAYDASSQTALHWAARGGHPLGAHECSGEAAHRADVVAALIDLGADVNTVDRRAAIPGGASGWTPLHIALHHEQFKVAERLLHRGADPRIRSRQGTSVVSMASQEGAPKELLAQLVAHQ